MNTKTILKQLGANYDCNAYGSGTYNNTDCATVTDTSPLADTGFDTIMLIALGLALLFAGLALLAKKILRAMKKNDQNYSTAVSPAPSRDEQDDR